MKYRILWLSPYIVGRVATVTRGIRLYDTPQDAERQIAKFKQHFPRNRYSWERA